MSFRTRGKSFLAKSAAVAVMFSAYAAAALGVTWLLYAFGPDFKSAQAPACVCSCDAEDGR